MFTGIIEKKGTIIQNFNHECGNRLIISSPFEELHAGESIAINGACLTLLPAQDESLNFDVSPETLSKTTLARLKAGDEVNLERAMLASARFGGHYVTAHVDAIAKIESIKHMNEFVEIELNRFSVDAMMYLIPKGSITVDGVSLTINSSAHTRIKLMLVPHTLINTTLGYLKLEQEVNIEFDYLTRIVAYQLQLLKN